ncbi:unnamed protein product [Psylliodes chrysocephalus]|uniref:Myb/SANT-like DNA-binding domain-containing protein n=1 Tax=Psylliodes chrysocephalus TaxID=3402493 RepID=A0A9P0GCE8_9CUCU|nr:unnamed protein product [Psylliodes chrysocephala]
MDNGTSQLSQFLSFTLSNVEEIEEKFFNHNRSLDLINLYKKYKSKIGTYEVKNMKKLWDLVARDISNMHKVTIASSKCENRFKVLDRNYKKFVDKNAKTGRGRTNFEFEKEFEEIYGGKSNVHPQVLLSSETEVVLHLDEENTHEVENDPQAPSETLADGSRNAENRPILTAKRRRTKVVTSTYKKRNEILTDMKNDLKTYYSEKIHIDREKLELDKEKHKEKVKRTELLKEHLEQLKIFNMNRQ